MSEPATPFDFDLEIVMLSYRIRQYFGSRALENPEIQEMFKEFGADSMKFVQLWDTINYQVMENALILDD